MIDGPVWWLIERLGELVAVTVIGVSLTQNLVFLMLLGLAGFAMARRPRARLTRTLWNGLVDQAPPMTILVPAFNEAATIVDSVRALLALHYPRFSVVVVNDGSSDATMARLEAAFALEASPHTGTGELGHAPLAGVYGSARHTNLLVLDKANGGKADALNAGINFVETEIFCSVDADSLLEADSLLRVVQSFVDDPLRTVAAGGTVRVANGCSVKAGRVKEVRLPKKLLPLLQTIEYLRAFMMARLAWGRLGALMIVSGAFGIFRRDVVIEVGGYSLGTVGEDLEIIMKIHRRMRAAGRDYVIEFVPEPVCWTQVPEDMSILAAQRIRWQRGALESFARHKGIFGRPRYGRVGALGMGNILLLDVVTPVVEALGYLLLPFFWLIGAVHWPFFLAYLALTFAFGVFISVGSLILEELELRRVPRATDLAILTLVAVLENFGYRQLNNVWRLMGHWRYLRGAAGWGSMRRVAFATG